MKLTRRHIRKMILREMRSVNEQTGMPGEAKLRPEYNPTVTISLNISDGGFNIDGESDDFAGDISELLEKVEALGEGIIFDVFPGIYDAGNQGLNRRGDKVEALAVIKDTQKRILELFR
jgi:hypothetical protein